VDVDTGSEAPAWSEAPAASTPAAPTPAVAPNSAITAPMPGVLLEYLVRVGDAVKAGDAVLVLEAMKMQNSLSAPRDARVAAIPFKAGDNVNRGDVLVTFE
jgi:biotin carboxyl carrier protein